MQRNFRNYDPRYLSISMEIKSFDANALLFFAANDQRVSIAMYGISTPNINGPKYTLDGGML